ncbi:serine/threonine-protein kinase [Kitasatospora sp. NPDC097691]|uniref:serine/threonine-protein kinase n=1 Tax=Kitasatospora sp. NPDC097691 TaxID=3157231 RepID=UPI00332C13BA
MPQPPVPTGLAPGHRPLGQDDPRRIGRYRLTAVLGQGGMGTVYLGRSPGQRLVAVKIVRPELAEDPVFRRRFAHEIEAAGLVGGFHTASVVDADPHGDPPWLATEYIPGPSLQDVLEQQGALPPRTLHTLAVGVAEALEHIHVCGIVHRDLKPGNIIVADTGPRIIDFGIARALDSTRLTGTGYVIGTQGFLAPEQLTGASITRAADLYAYGMVLCHAAGAAPLADGESLASALGLLPARFAGVITRCLDHDPGRRPTATQVLDLLAPNVPSTGDWLPLPVRRWSACTTRRLPRHREPWVSSAAGGRRASVTAAQRPRSWTELPKRRRARVPV